MAMHVHEAASANFIQNASKLYYITGTVDGNLQSCLNDVHLVPSVVLTTEVMSYSLRLLWI